MATASLRFFLVPVLIVVAFADEDSVRTLSELSIRDLLSQKKSLAEGRGVSEGHHRSRPIIDPIESMQIKGLHRVPSRKTIFDDDEDEEDAWFPKKKSKNKFSKLFEVSVTALSFLAFGSYLLCLMASVMRQRTSDALTAVGSTVSPQILLQQILNSNKQTYPIRIPASAFTIHSGRRRRRRTSPYGYYEEIYKK